jgi:hypothetical protein
MIKFTYTKTFAKNGKEIPFLDFVIQDAQERVSSWYQDASEQVESVTKAEELAEVHTDD